MRAKTNQLNKGVNLKQSAFNGNIQKKTQDNKKSSTVAKKAKDLFKKNLHFLLKGKFPHQQSSLPLITLDRDPNEYVLPQSDDDDRDTHIAVAESLARPYALHSSATWQPSDSEHYKRPSTDHIPRSWKETMQNRHFIAYNLSKRQLQYQELIYEIILTEQTYLDDLILMYKIFISDSIQWLGLPNATKLLFSSLYNIIILHVQFLAALKERQSSTQIVYSITDIFSLFAPKFEIYTTYFANFAKANNEITECIKSQNQFGAYITRRQAWPECRNLPFAAYLLTPLQRMMKYPLFFNSLLECLDDNDFRVPNIKTFIGELDMILQFFNQQQKDAEDFAKLEDLQKRIKTPDNCCIAVPGRKLIHEGYLNIILPSSSEVTGMNPDDDIPSSLMRRGSTYSQKPTKRDSGVPQTPSLLRRSSTFSLAPRKNVRAYVFLFNDIVLFTKISKHKLNPRNTNTKRGSFYGPSPDCMFKIIHTPDVLTGLNASLPPGTPRRGSFFGGLFRQPSIRNMNHASQQDEYQFHCTIGMTSFHLEADTPQEKEAWYGHMAQLIDTTNQNEAANDSSFPPTSINNIQFVYDSDSSASILSDEYDDDEVDDEIVVPDVEEFDEKERELFTSTITNAFFTDSIWSAGATADLSSFELTNTFEDIL